MGFRFRKSINLGGGFRLNLGKRSAGISFGVRGARVSINSRGRKTVTVGIPGTGVYWQKSSSVRRQLTPRTQQHGNPGCFTVLVGLLVLAVILGILIQHWLLLLLVLAGAIVYGVVAYRKKDKSSNEQLMTVPCPQCSTAVKIPVDENNSSVHVQCSSCGARIQVNLHYEQMTTQWTTNETPTSITRYHELLQQIEKARSNHEYGRVLELSIESIYLLPAFVSECIREYGQWDIPIVPCIIYACRYLSVIPDEHRLGVVREIIASVPQLADWLETVDEAMETCELTRRVYAYIENNPGCLQRHLGKALNENGRWISNVIRYAEQLGRIKRIPFQRTYQLYLATLD
ncbi:MAG: DUF4236 domain-containing protein [Alicyclobacillus macrosporangiidus]|uniref:DUF4236 domain-containing protein n=1 Tax=Alicyclobacillus macrosporangiidus TaxID=392015 RepID=UPI0026EF0284|nr:DUF4236 domain-containing protein [Alicyclobacillus macrosporangiidus]MCL6597937.1 DUF4236 domain-containing protein [Alicyclobacillus macrosporangiidus]